MISQRQLFLHHLAQTSDSPMLLEIEKAEGIYLYDIYGKRYLDLISGISVSNVGHRHPKVLEAIRQQMDKYLYLMVYGEYIQSPQVLLAKKLSQLMPEGLDNVYFMNSGSESIEGAMKLAKRYTGRKEIICFSNAYHGSTQGALSLIGSEEMKSPFTPLLPGIKSLPFNNVEALANINSNTACVVAEMVQGEAGIIPGTQQFISALRKRCTETGALLVADEIQSGFGRSGSLWAFEQYGIVPDIVCIAKAMGGGMPLGAFVASKQVMSSLTHHPVLGHISTFGGHPVSCAAALAAIEVLEEENLVFKAGQKAALFSQLLKHPKIKELRAAGLMMALELGSEELNKKVILSCIEKGLITDWFLFCQSAMRIAPPLTIGEEEIKEACNIILSALDAA